jgi:hypothetical protein
LSPSSGPYEQSTLKTQKINLSGQSLRFPRTFAELTLGNPQGDFGPAVPTDSQEERADFAANKESFLEN